MILMTAAMIAACAGVAGEILVLNYVQIPRGPVVDGILLRFPKERFDAAETLRRGNAKFGRPSVDTGPMSVRRCAGPARCTMGAA